MKSLCTLLVCVINLLLCCYWEKKASLIKSCNLCVLGCLKDMSSAVKITSPHLKSLDIVILDLYVQYINADVVFRDLLSINWNSTINTFTSPGISAMKIFGQLTCETERRGKRIEDWLAKRFLCYDFNTLNPFALSYFVFHINFNIHWGFTIFTFILSYSIQL